MATDFSKYEGYTPEPWVWTKKGTLMLDGKDAVVLFTTESSVFAMETPNFRLIQDTPTILRKLREAEAENAQIKVDLLDALKLCEDWELPNVIRRIVNGDVARDRKAAELEDDNG